MSTLRESLEAAVQEREQEIARLTRELEETNRGVVALYAELDERSEALRRASEAKSRLLEEAERARHDAEEASRAKSEFLTTMSHELRTPINAMLGYAQLIDMGISGAVSPEQRAHLDRLRRSGAHLLTLVNELLDLAQVEQGRLRMARETALVADVVEDALAVARPMASSRGTFITEATVAPGLTYVGDSGRVRQILINLLSNAIKFSRPGDGIDVRADAGTPPETAVVEGDASYLAIDVVDSGIGIEPERLEAMFEPFVQADRGRTRRHDGSGVGLAISRRLARLMHGDLTVRSELGKGSCFRLWLPMATEDALAVTRETATPSHAATIVRDTTQLAQLGRDLVAASASIGNALVVRLRSAARSPLLGAVGDARLTNHTPAFVADLGQALVIMGSVVGGDVTDLLQDGTAIRVEIAARHGEQRSRLGWSAEDLTQEYVMLTEEIERVVRSRAVEGRVDDALALLRGLIEQSAAAALRSFRAAGGREPNRSDGI